LSIGGGRIVPMARPVAIAPDGANAMDAAGLMSPVHFAAIRLRGHALIMCRVPPNQPKKTRPTRSDLSLAPGPV
jgi:hypothetical protein